MTPLSVCGIVGKGKRGVAMAMLTHEWHQRPVSQQTSLQSWMLVDMGGRYVCVFVFVRGYEEAGPVSHTHTHLDSNTHKHKHAHVEKASSPPPLFIRTRAPSSVLR